MGTDPTSTVTSLPNLNLSPSHIPEANNKDWQKLGKSPNLGKAVRFSETEEVEKRNSLEESLFPDHGLDKLTTTSFEELFSAEDWLDLTAFPSPLAHGLLADDHLLWKKLLKPGHRRASCPVCGQEVILKMESVLEDRSVVEKDCKLVFVTGEGDVNQALEECAITMWKEEIALLLADSRNTYGLLGRSADQKSGLRSEWSTRVLTMNLIFGCDLNAVVSFIGVPEVVVLTKVLRKHLSDNGKYEEAMETLKKALKLEPSTKRAQVIKVEMVCSRGGNQRELARQRNAKKQTDMHKGKRNDDGLSAAARKQSEAKAFGGWLGAKKGSKEATSLQENIKDRLTFCRKYRDWTAEDWGKVIFSEEAPFRLWDVWTNDCPEKKTVSATLSPVMPT
ncbi:hypothetical protein P4O66_018292, partial [Electrophorus voltai]